MSIKLVKICTTCNNDIKKKREKKERGKVKNIKDALIEGQVFRIQKHKRQKKTWVGNLRF